MTKKRSEPRKMSTPTPFEQARDELFSHILRCGVLEATPEHQQEWFDDTTRSKVARAVRPFRADERQSQPTIRPDAPALERAEQELRGRLEADAQRSLVIPARGREGQASLTTGAPCHSHLWTPEATVRQEHRRAGADLRRSRNLGTHRHRDARGHPGRGQHGPSPVPTLRTQADERSDTPGRNGASEARRRR